jgi:hypothetical protein
MLRGWRFFLCVVMLVGGLIACETQTDDDEPAPPTLAPAPTDPGEAVFDPGAGPSGPTFLGNVPLPAEFRAFDGLTIVDSTKYVVDNTLVVGLLVRNDSNAMIARGETLITLLDSDGIRLSSSTFRTAQGNIAVGDTIAITERYPIADLIIYDDAFIAVQASRSEAAEVNATSILGVDDTAELLLNDAGDVARGEVLNPSERPLLTPIVHFVFYGANDALITISAGQIVSGLSAFENVDNVVWQPGATLIVEAMLPPLPDDVAVDDIVSIQARVVGLDYAAFAD